MPTEPPIMPKAPEPVNYGPVGQAPVATPPPAKKKFPLWIIIAAVIFTVLIVFIAFKRSANTPTSVAPQPTPTPTNIPQVERPLSAVATSAAFVEFETQLDVVTRGIQNAPIDNQSLLPPRLDLPLGF